MPNPRQIIATVAARYLGVREKSTNWSPEIEKFWTATNYPDGADDRQPWCAAFCCFVLQQADRESESLRFSVPPRSAAVRDWVPWAQRKDVGGLVFTPTSKLYTPQPGDVVEFLPHLSHIGIVERVEGKTVWTIEGNTDDSGGREGVKVARRPRALSYCGHFIRVPAVGEKLS